MSSLFVAPLSLTVAISPLQSPFVAPLLRYSCGTFATFRHAAVMFFLHISCATPTRLCLNCVSTIPDNWVIIHLVAEMKILFSFPWRFETVHRTLVTKRGDGAATSDQLRLALSQLAVARKSPPSCERGITN